MRPIDRRGSNPARALGGVLAGLVFAWFVVAMGALLWVVAG